MHRLTELREDQIGDIHEIHLRRESCSLHHEPDTPRRLPDRDIPHLDSMIGETTIGFDLERKLWNISYLDRGSIWLKI
jgi:hypothetical protein